MEYFLYFFSYILLPVILNFNYYTINESCNLQGMYRTGLDYLLYYFLIRIIWMSAIKKEQDLASPLWDIVPSKGLFC